MFNVRVKKYLNTEQIQIFSEPLLSSGSEREDKRKVVYATGEIVPTNRKKIRNVFDEEIVIGYEFHDETENDKKRSYRRTKNKIYDIVKSNHWEWFFTLTFNPEKVDSFDYDLTSKKLSKWLNNMRVKCPDMSYMVVPEQHQSGRWHFHGLFANVENMVFVDSGISDKQGRTVYNVGKYRFGWSTATQITDVSKASSYLTKYVTKELCDTTKGKKRYWNSRNIQLPQVTDYLIEGKKEMMEYLERNALYQKQIDGYMQVTYMEVPLGDSDFLSVL